MQIFLVGGAVRDSLLNLSVKERDWVVVGAAPSVMREQGFIEVGKDFPVFLHPETKEEYALARTERKVKPGYHGFVFNADEQVTLKEDLRRRDLTINAMAYDENRQLIDPWGGMDDLHNKVLRHVSAAFAEDPVRVLRLARFAARFHSLGFSVAESTMELARTMAANGEVSALVPERVWQELHTALGEPTPAEFFIVLHDADALSVVLPELAGIFNDAVFAEQAMDAINRARSHLQSQSDDKRVVFAVLMAYAVLGSDAGDAVIDDFCQRLRTPKAYWRFARAVLVLQDSLPQLTLAEMDAENLLEFFERSGLLRQDAMFDPLALAGNFLKAASDMDAKDKYELFNLLRRADETLRTLDLAGVVAECSQPGEIKQAVRAARLNALTDLSRIKK